jgi:hypothetical protein
LAALLACVGLYAALSAFFAWRISRARTTRRERLVEVRAHGDRVARAMLDTDVAMLPPLAEACRGRLDGAVLSYVAGNAPGVAQFVPRGRVADLYRRSIALDTPERAGFGETWSRVVFAMPWNWAETRLFGEIYYTRGGAPYRAQPPAAEHAYLAVSVLRAVEQPVIDGSNFVPGRGLLHTRVVTAEDGHVVCEGTVEHRTTKAAYEGYGRGTTEAEAQRRAATEANVRVLSDFSDSIPETVVAAICRIRRDPCPHFAE